MADPLSQNALRGAEGSAAELIGGLGAAMYIGGAAILLLVIALAVYGVAGRPRSVSERYWIVGGGLVFPVVTLSVLLVYSLAVGNALSAIGSSRALQLFLECFGAGDVVTRIEDDRLIRVHITGKQWWWDVRYDLGSGEQAVLANELRLPTDRPVELVLTTTDVIHSLWIPTLAGKVDMIPGRTTRLRIQTSEQGRFMGLCAEYCGGQHALMKFAVVSMSPNRFDDWLTQQARPAAMPTETAMRRGYDAFFAGSCHTCHTVRGTPARGEIGPDLTHIGSRETLAAGALDNHIGTMAGWIAGAQDLKPGNAMPSMPVYSGEDLRALAAWLGSLE